MKDKIVLLSFTNKMPEKTMFKFLEIPALASEYEDVLHRIRITDADISKAKIHISTRKILHGVDGVKVNDATIEELNFFGERVMQLSEEELYALSAVLKIGHTKDLCEDGLTVKDLINMTYGLDKVYVFQGIDCDKELGETLICAQSEEYMENMSDEELKALDSDEVGRKCREKENGIYINETYVAIGKREVPDVYDGITLPDEKYPDYRLGVIQLLVTGTLTASQTYLSDNEVWITLPINRAECDRIARCFGKNSITECTICSVKSAIPEINMNMLSKTNSFEAINKLALAYLNMNNEEKIKYKAILEREMPISAEKAVELIDDITKYEIDTEVFERGDFTRKYFSKMLPEGFNVDLIKEREYKMIGTRLMQELDLYKTSYGFISQKDRGLYEIVREEQAQEENEELEIGGMQM